MSKILSIDTSDNKKVKIELSVDGQVLKKVLASKKRKSQTVLPTIEKILDSKKLSLRDLTEIKVSKGPGSFTGLRVGIAIANSLSFLLKIPVNNKKVGDLETPVYN